jgi:ATP-dependent RNA helicase DDX41
VKTTDEPLVHRIGRTGRSRRTGTATTFVDKSCTETLLLDLKELLIESRQPIPPFMKQYVFKFFNIIGRKFQL